MINYCKPTPHYVLCYVYYYYKCACERYLLRRSQRYLCLLSPFKRCAISTYGVYSIKGLGLYFCCAHLYMCYRPNKVVERQQCYFTTVYKYNCMRWITRLVCRWRVQPTVWINVNRRLLWTSTSWTHIAAIGLPVATSVRASAYKLSLCVISSGWGDCHNNIGYTSAIEVLLLLLLLPTTMINPLYCVVLCCFVRWIYY